MINNDTPHKISMLFKIIFVIFGIILLTIIYQTVQLWQIRHYWPITHGVVVKVSTRGWWNEKRHRRYYLKYQYEVSGKKYVGERFHIKEKSIKRYTYLIRHFRKNDQIQVWYDPEKPNQAVINTDYLMNSFALIIVFTGFLIMVLTMILKEKLWLKRTHALVEAVYVDYNGVQPLPSSRIINDRGDILKLNTGMSVFWSFGVPFLFFSFVSLFFMMVFLNEINPGWLLSDYLIIVVSSFACSIVFGFFVTSGFKKVLEINKPSKKIKEISKSLFKRSEKIHDFSDIKELSLHRDTWRKTNSLKSWIFYIRTISGQPLYISFRHRDIQPAYESYLGILKERIKYLVSGD